MWRTPTITNPTKLILFTLRLLKTKENGGHLGQGVTPYYACNYARMFSGKDAQPIMGSITMQKTPLNLMLDEQTGAKQGRPPEGIGKGRSQTWMTVGLVAKRQTPFKTNMCTADQF